MSRIDDRPRSRGEEIADEIIVAFPADDDNHIIAGAAIAITRLMAAYGAPLPATLDAWRAINADIERQISWALAHNDR